MIKKLNNMLYCITIMAIFNARADIINIHYNFTVGGVMPYCPVAWCGNATKTDIEHMDSIIRKASKVIRISKSNIDSIHVYQESN